MGVPPVLLECTGGTPMPQRTKMLLLLLILIPLIGAIVGAFLNDPKMARGWALFVALATLLVAALLIPKFDYHQNARTLDQTVQVRFGFTADNPFSISDPINFA